MKSQTTCVKYEVDRFEFKERNKVGLEDVKYKTLTGLSLFRESLLTRLETRTKEFNTYASKKVKNLNCEMKVRKRY